mgnify:CR=1 FL=1
MARSWSLTGSGNGLGSTVGGLARSPSRALGLPAVLSLVTMEGHHGDTRTRKGPAAIKLEVDEDKVAAHAKEKGISEDEARDYMQTVVDGLQAQAMLLFRSRGTSTTDPEVLAGARAAFVGGVRLIEGVTFEGGPDTISDSEAAGFLWDYADDWLRDAICSDLVDLNSPGADDLGN